MCAYRKLLRSFSGVSTLTIRYQTLEIIDGQARIFADIVFHDLSPDEYNLTLEQVVNSHRPHPTSNWISSPEINNQVLLCKATVKYRDIRQFKALEEQQQAEAASENGITVTKNDLESISSIDDVIRVASKTCLDFAVKNEAEYRPSFEYHVVEDAILNVNGWECLRRDNDRVLPIEDDEWLVTRKNILLREYPWMAAFDPPKYLLEYGLKLLTVTPDAKGSADLRRRMLTKTLRRRVNEAVKKNSDLGHTFCIAILLIAIHQCGNQWYNN